MASSECKHSLEETRYIHFISWRAIHICQFRDRCCGLMRVSNLTLPVAVPEGWCLQNSFRSACCSGNVSVRWPPFRFSCQALAAGEAAAAGQLSMDALEDAGYGDGFTEAAAGARRDGAGVSTPRRYTQQMAVV